VNLAALAPGGTVVADRRRAATAAGEFRDRLERLALTGRAALAVAGLYRLAVNPHHILLQVRLAPAW
jgi:hypothetical protein